MMRVEPFVTFTADDMTSIDKEMGIAPTNLSLISSWTDGHGNKVVETLHLEQCQMWSMHPDTLTSMRSVFHQMQAKRRPNICGTWAKKASQGSMISGLKIKEQQTT